MSILIFLAVLFVLVLVHELGHFAVAKWTGMRVDEFGIGFPPKIFGIKRGETEYTLNLFPIGGFVKIFGEDGVGDPSARLNENLSARSDREIPLSGQPRYEEDGAEAGQGGEDGVIKLSDTPSNSFTSKNRWAQAAVLVAGVAMNILLAWVLVTIAFSIGVQSVVSEDEATDSARLTITSVLSESPAGQVEIPQGAIVKGVQAGDDTLLEFTPSAFSAFIATHFDEQITLVYTSGGEPSVVMLRAEANIINDKPEQYAVGVSLAQVDILKRGFLDSVIASSVFVVTGLRDITVGIVGLLSDALTLKADFSQVAGPVGIVGLVGEASALGITTLLMFTAFISLNLAVINILPFPALDGGRLLIVGIEAVKGSPIRPHFVGILNTIGFVLLIMLMIAVTWNDIARLM